MEPGSSKLDTILNKASTVLKVSAEKGADLLFTSVIRDSVRPGMNLKNVFLLLGHIFDFFFVCFLPPGSLLPYQFVESRLAQAGCRQPVC